MRENTFDERKKRPGLKFNPWLALIGLRTTGPREEKFILCSSPLTHNLILEHASADQAYLQAT